MTIIARISRKAQIDRHKNHKNMNSLILVLCVAAVASALSDGVTQPPVKLIKSYEGREDDGSYKFGFETDDGYARDETIKVVNEGQDNRMVLVSGSYKYTDPDGVVVEVQYTADEHGFYPVGSHIPEVISKTAKEVGAAKSVRR